MTAWQNTDTVHPPLIRIGRRRLRICSRDAVRYCARFGMPAEIPYGRAELRARARGSLHWSAIRTLETSVLGSTRPGTLKLRPVVIDVTFSDTHKPRPSTICAFTNSLQFSGPRAATALTGASYLQVKGKRRRNPMKNTLNL